MARFEIDTERNRSLAVHHANLLQDRKDKESEILDSLEALIDFPTAINASSAAPSSSDLDSFRVMIKPFQVSDYDALLEERNLTGKCGYVFCPKPFPKETRQRGLVQIGTGRNGKIIPRREVRKWCSEMCAKRAMYIKVQLSDVPSWERASGAGNRVDVLEENDAELAVKIESLSLQTSPEEEIASAMTELALERGENRSSARKPGVFKNGLIEKPMSAVAHPPTINAEADASLAIDGYVPRGGSNGHGDSQIESHGDTISDDEIDEDWDLT